MKETAKAVIIGGGAIGLSVAYHLGKLGWTDLVLLERNELTSGTSWHAAGIIGPLRSSLNLTRLAQYSADLFARIEEETGQATGFRQTGGMWLAQTQERMVELRRIAAIGELVGLSVRELSPKQVGERFPLARTADLAGGLWVDEDGQANPVDICMAYAKGARMCGVDVREQMGVRSIETKQGRVQGVLLDNGDRIVADIVINCAGAWASEIGATAGAPLPLHAAEHMYVVSEPIAGLPQPCPIIRDLDARIYLKEDAGKLVLGGFEPNAKPWSVKSADPKASYLSFDEDWDQFEPFLHAGLHRVPALETAGIQHFMNGPESFTIDTKQAMGEMPNVRGLFVAAGFNSIGIMSSAGVGKALAQWVVEGAAPMDLWDVDVARFEPSDSAPGFVVERLQEVVSNQFDMHWPYKQMKTGRLVRRSVLHRAFAEKGAVFGAPTGWERPLWFAREGEDTALTYSVGTQSWWSIAEREGRSLMHDVALFELSPFGKFELSGPDACTLLQRLCAANIEREPGAVVYSPMLNRRGGFEADVTVTRLAEDRFWIVSGAATRTRDRMWMDRQIDETMRVGLTDVTSSYAVIGLMGPKSRDLLASLSQSDLSAEGFPFSTSRMIDIGSVVVRATRVSFVGELGWELYVRTEFAEYVHQVLCEHGATHGLVHAGHFCLDGCRMEKGFRHWSHEIGPDNTPLEAGLGFAVSWSKDFLGRDALLKQKQDGLKRRLLLFEVENANPLLLHDELILRDGRTVGLTTSGALGPRTGKALSFGWVDANLGESLNDLRSASYEIQVAGERYPLTPLSRPPYDPDGLRMRG